MTGPLGKYRSTDASASASAAAEPETPVQPASPAAAEPETPVQPASPAAAEPAAPAVEPTLAFLMEEIARLRKAQEEQIQAVEEKAARDLRAADEAAGIRLWPNAGGVRCIGRTNAKGIWEPSQAIEAGIVLQEIQIPERSTDPVWPARVVVCLKGLPPETVPRSLTSILAAYTDADWNSLRDAVRECRSAEREQEYQELRAERGKRRGVASGASRRKY